VSGKSLLHLQCHFGLDTMSWARLGAKATGVDFSQEAVATARSLAGELGIAADFVRSNVYDLPKNLDGRFDVVFTSHGVLPWLPDLGRWAEVVAHFLKPGGVFYIVESHPFAQMFDDGIETPELRIRYPYFRREPMRFEDDGSYADPKTVVRNKTTYEWMHPLGEIVNSLLAVGLRIESFREYPFCAWKMLPFMVRDEDGWWRLPDGREDVPLMFSLRAVKIPAD
jgi:SAM-dependent methyltransferase